MGTMEPLISNDCSSRDRKRPRVTHVESSVHRLAEPDVFAVLALAGPPVLARDA